MRTFSSIFYSVYHYIAELPPKIYLNTPPRITNEHKKALANKLAGSYYIILTGNKWHLSSFIIRLFTLFLTGRWTRYSHALMNCDFITDPDDRASMKFVEATAVGVHYSTFDDVFSCDYVCLLSPKDVTLEEWTAIIDGLVRNNGKPYDDLFDLSDQSKISCVELVLDSLKDNPEYLTKFYDLETMIKAEGNLVPEMFRQCPDFQIDYEV